MPSGECLLLIVMHLVVPLFTQNMHLYSSSFSFWSSLVNLPQYGQECRSLWKEEGSQKLEDGITSRTMYWQ